jgi:hypothetical protein
MFSACILGYKHFRMGSIAPIGSSKKKLKLTLQDMLQTPPLIKRLALSRNPNARSRD